MSKKRCFLSTALFLLITLAAVANAEAAVTAAGKTIGPDAICARLMSGRTYGQQFSGFIDMGTLVPNAGGGYLKFRSDGSVTGRITIIVGSQMQIIDLPTEGSYSLKWDAQSSACTGSASVSMFEFQLVLSKGGESLEMIHTDMGLSLNFTSGLKEQGPCTEKTLATTYTYSARGWMLPPPNFEPPPGVPAPAFMLDQMPFTFSGAISFDGKGNLMGKDVVSLGGLVPRNPGTGEIIARTYTGTYVMNSDCTSTMTLIDSFGNPPLNTEAIVLKGADGLIVVNTDPGITLSFTALRASSR